MTTDKDALLIELDELEESAKLLGRTEAKKEFGCYTQGDFRFALAMRQSISKHRARITAALAGQDDCVRVPKGLLGGLLTDLHNITYSIDHCGDYYATKNGPMYGYAKDAQGKIRTILAAAKEPSNPLATPAATAKE